MEYHKVIAQRVSRRAYADRPVEPEKIERMIEAARWSPSCANRQPWRFVIVGRNDPSRAALDRALDEGNSWARRAPVLIVAGARKADAAVVESREYFLLDTGLATMSLLYRGVDQGLLVHPMAGWKEEPLRAALSLPGDFLPAVVVAVGYAGNPEDLDEQARKKDEKPRVRKATGEIAFSGRWGNPFRGTLPSGPAKVYETDIPLRFGDIDAMGHVNNAVTMTLFELGRAKFFAEVLGVRRVEDYEFILAEAKVRYRLPILLQDEVRLRMHITDVARSSFRFQAELFDPRDGRVFTEAETVQVMYDYTTGRAKPVSAEFLAKVEDYIGG
ncbi:MAG TPA: thioesterase family protein [Candidatus Deferrimicrobiaceae bacterium]|nr:thioesterase family protein [Candidatus Deferrimicrobiaceae bacterium]